MLLHVEIFKIFYIIWVSSSRSAYLPVALGTEFSKTQPWPQGSHLLLPPEANLSVSIPHRRRFILGMDLNLLHHLSPFNFQ